MTSRRASIVEELLADAIAGAITIRFGTGLGFLRLPQIATPLPVAEIIDRVRPVVPDVWVGDFTGSIGSAERVTDDVRLAVRWRNEGRMPLLIAGDLNRNRAKGLSSITQVSASEVRGRLFDALAADTASDFSVQIRPLLRALRAWDLPLHMVADYCAALMPLGIGSGDQARSELWRLGFLPDVSSSRIESARLRLNQQTVDRIRSSDLATIQRLISTSAPSYAVLRKFARTNDHRLLAHLRMDEVMEALSRARRPARSTRSEAESPSSARPPRVPDLIDVVLTGEVDEDALLEAVQTQAGQRSLEFGGDRVVWAGTSIAEVLGDSSIPEGSGALSQRTLNPDPTDLPPRGSEAQSNRDGEPTEGWLAEFYSQVSGAVATNETLRWSEMSAIGRQIEELALDAPTAGADAQAALYRIISARTELAPFAGSIAGEGVRLLFSSCTLRRHADDLVAGWDELWDALRRLRDALPSEVRTEVRRVANDLTLVDVVVESMTDGVKVRLLPLHPAVIEPRARAAAMFLKQSENEEVDPEFVETVSVNLDPAAPSIGVVLDNTPEALAFAGIDSTGLPVYAKRRLASGTEETVRLARQLIDRFVAVHPFAAVSFSVALVEPTAAVVTRLYQNLAYDAHSPFARVRMRVFLRSGQEAMREEVSKAAAGDTDEETSRVQIDIIEGEPGRDSLLSGGAPHLLMMFNISDKGDATFGALWESPQQGSVVSEWKFVPLRRMTVIKPSPSGQLATLLNKQAELASGGQAELLRSPLLTDQEEVELADVGSLATWLVLVEPTSALAAPENLDSRLDLLGRLNIGAHTAYVYGYSARLLVQPALGMLQGNSWLDPDPESLLTFLTTAVQRALPEGLLGFFGSGGAFRDDAVLGRVGVAAVLAELQERDEDTLVVSLDSETARQWLQRRPSNKRADLLCFSWRDGQPRVEAVEVKATKELHPDRIPNHVFEAADQVREMLDVLSGIFGTSSGDPFSASRREILKRQVFLEALQQWEQLRVEDWSTYRQRIARLNTTFGPSESEPPVIISGRVVVVGPDAPAGAYPKTIGDDNLPLEVLGGSWLRKALRHGRGHASIPTDLGDLIPLGTAGDIVESGLLQNAGVVYPSGELDGVAEGQEVSTARGSQPETQERSVQDEGRAEYRVNLGRRVSAALRARQVPLRRLDPDEISEGPSVLRVPFELEAGARLSTLASQEADLARDLGVSSVRVDNLSGKARYAVIEVPRENRIIADVSSLALPSGPAVSIALGSGLDFAPFWLALSDLPHLLVAGTTGSGKSMLIRSVLWQLTRLYGPNDVDLVLIDAKGMNDYRDLARAPQFRSTEDYHLGSVGALELLVDIVERRLPARVADFNRYADEALSRSEPQMFADIVALAHDALSRGERPPIKPLVVIIDEFAELVLSTSDKRRFEAVVTRFVQRARAVGGHLIAATQRPSVEIVPGVMKANFARASLRVQSAVDSRVILDSTGAEMLLPRGDMLYASAELGLVRLQGFAAHGPYPPVL